MSCTGQENFLFEPDIWKKIERSKLSLDLALDRKLFGAPQNPARPADPELPHRFPPKPGLSTKLGQARTLHDLASIELQALELGLRTLIEFPDAPDSFREELHQVALSESEHLRLCLEVLADLGFKFGDFPFHIALWQSVSSSESLLDRILVVHRYLEGSGLDAGETLLRRLSGVPVAPIHQVVSQIVREEVDHVYFGSKWYSAICKNEGLDPATDFPLRLQQIERRLPQRIEPLSVELRKRAGFTEHEIYVLNERRRSKQKFTSEKSKPEISLESLLSPALGGRSSLGGDL